MRGLSPWLALVAARIVADQWLWARHCPHGPAPLLALFRDISWPDLADGGVLGLLAVAEGAPTARDLRFARPWSVRPMCAGCFLGLHLVPWLCPHGPALPHGCSWTGLLSRPGLMVG
ncbi:hypothetical protein V6N13_116049 [Hibiscus sabdariffa]|uniref:Uncharacterized protein n=1 Tax=Hibiscus sabdariffa TaxID=183260 RepID=A0ABR2QT39_9ROSI